VSVVSLEIPDRAYDAARRRALLTDLTAALGALPPGAIDAFGFASEEPSFIRRGFQAFIRLPGQTRDQAKMTLFCRHLARIPHHASHSDRRRP